MRLSLLQPEIVRGDIEHNLQAVQRLIDTSEGDLMVCPEYVLTGSLVLDPNANVREWVARSDAARSQLRAPAGRFLLLIPAMRRSARRPSSEVWQTTT